MVKNWSRERELMESGLWAYQPFSIASYWQGWERKKRKHSIDQYKTMWTLLISILPSSNEGFWSKKERNSAICCFKLQSLSNRLVKNKKSMSLSVSLSRQSFWPEILSLRMPRTCWMVLKDCVKRFRPKVQATSIKGDLSWRDPNPGPPEWVHEEWVHDRLRPALCDDAKTPDKQVYILVNT